MCSCLFYKQKTAYELRISDWSSDVCSSDLSGARAASAGTYILYASHVAAMMPGTNLGAATPVQMGGGGLPFGGSDDKPAEGKDKGPPPKTAMEKKIVNDVTAYIRALADLRGRNAAWTSEAHTSELQSLMRISYA